MTRRPVCVWVERDELGRPRCEHGWAIKSGTRWQCRWKHMRAVTKYRHSELGRAFRRRENQSANAKSSKALYNLTRVRFRLDEGR